MDDSANRGSNFKTGVYLFKNSYCLPHLLVNKVKDYLYSVWKYMMTGNEILDVRCWYQDSLFYSAFFVTKQAIFIKCGSI